MSEPREAIAKPLPELEGLTGEFYGFCRRGELRFQRCRDCGSWRHVPRDMCAGCGSWQWEWALSSGRGVVYSWTVVGRALHPAFEHDTPYAPVIVEMDEGVRLLSRVEGVAPADLEIDLPVEVGFESVTPEVSLPFFRRAER
ncbi:MAG: Zn-ribbon domain-containing OB-fold protein [Myxococcota bacterium]